MTVCGIIAEYNPFHTGHLYHIGRARELSGAEGVVAVMSGNFVQRGEAAVFDKYSRAKAACASGGGADLVLELPLTFSCAPAERFASGGVAVLEACGVVSSVVFGSECGEVDRLSTVADFLESREFGDALKLKISSGVTFAAARQEIVSKALGSHADALCRPNDTLGVEYIRAIKRQRSTMVPIAIKRSGAPHDSDIRDQYVSASLLRQLICEGFIDEALKYIPPAAATIFENCISEGLGPSDPYITDLLMLSQLKRMTDIQFEQLPDVSEGLGYRVCSAVKQATSAGEAADIAKTKRYTHARIRRILLSAYLGISKKLAEKPLPYIRVLAFNDTGRNILRKMKDTASLPILTKTADVIKLSEDARMIFSAEALASDLYSLSCPDKNLRKSGRDYIVSPIYVK